MIYLFITYLGLHLEISQGGGGGGAKIGFQKKLLGLRDDLPVYWSFKGVRFCQGGVKFCQGGGEILSSGAPFTPFK